MDKNEEIRRELLDFFSLNKISVSNQYEVAKFLNGETEFSLDEIQKIIDNETNKIEKRKTRESLHEKIVDDHVKNNKYKLDESNIDYNLAELTPQDKYKIKIDLIQLEDPVSGKPTNITNITNNTNKHDVAFNNNDMFKFSNGTSETRATHFVLEGKGYTTLETPAYIQEQNIISNEGLQVSLQDELSNRSVHYAKGQANRTGDRPVIIEGEIPAQYVFDNYEHEGEYSIPKEYYNKIENAIIKDAETQTPLYSFNKKDGLKKLDTYTDYNYPELKIKSEDTIKLQNRLVKEVYKDRLYNGKRDYLDFFLEENSDELKKYNLYQGKNVKEIRKEIENKYLNNHIALKDFDGDFEKALKAAFEASPVTKVPKEEALKKYVDVFSEMAWTNESRDMILDVIANAREITNEEFFKANAKELSGQYVNHGLYAYGGQMWDVDSTKLDYQRSQINSNLKKIIEHPEYEISASTTDYAIGNVGITAKIKDAKYASRADAQSGILTNGNGKRILVSQYNIGGLLKEDYDIIGQKNIPTYSPTQHNEIISTIEKPEKIWVKKEFYEENKDFVYNLMKENDIQNLDIILNAENERITESEIKTVTLSDLEKSEDTISQLKNRLNITEDVSAGDALDIIDDTLDDIKSNKYWLPQEEEQLKNFQNIIADFENGRTTENDHGGKGVDYFKEVAKDIEEEVKRSKDKLKELPKQEELEELRELYNTQYKNESVSLELETVDLSNHKNRNTVRYHNSKDATIIYDISEMGDNIKIANSVGHSGTWTSKQEHGIKSISNWVELNSEILEYDEQDPKKLLGYITEFEYKEDANILYIHDDETLRRVLYKYGNGKEKIYWDKVASDFDAVRIDSKPVGISTYQRKVSQYYGDTDVIFNPDIFETITTYNADEYFDKKYIPSKNLTSKEAFDKYSPNDDRFYISQGLDPEEQKQAIYKLNSGREYEHYSDKDLYQLYQLREESKEAADKFLETTKELEKDIQQAEKELRPKPRKIKQAKFKKVKPEIKSKVDVKEDILNEAKTVEKQVIKSSKLQNKTIQDTAKKSLDTKKLGLFIAGAIAIAGTASMLAPHKDKKKKNKKEKIQHKTGLYESFDYNDYDKDTKNAKKISSFSKGHSTYSLR